MLYFSQRRYEFRPEVPNLPGASQGLSGKESACIAGATGDTGWIRVGKIPWRRAWQPTPVFLPRESPWIEEPGGATVHVVTKSQTLQDTTGHSRTLQDTALCKCVRATVSIHPTLPFPCGVFPAFVSLSCPANRLIGTIFLDSVYMS